MAIANTELGAREEALFQSQQHPKQIFSVWRGAQQWYIKRQDYGEPNEVEAKLFCEYKNGEVVTMRG